MGNVGDDGISDWGDEAGQRRGAWDVRGRTWAKVLFVVVLVGLGFIQGMHMADAPDTPVAYQEGRLVAVDALKHALYTPSGQARAGGPRAGVQFDNAAGEHCRRFIDRDVRGTACQQDGDWRIIELRQEAVDPDAGVVGARPAGAGSIAGPAAPAASESPAVAQPQQQNETAGAPTGN